MYWGLVEEEFRRYADSMKVNFGSFGWLVAEVGARDSIIPHILVIVSSFLLVFKGGVWWMVGL
jgi:hypothetical protein